MNYIAENGLKSSVSFGDVLLVPRFSEIVSRKDISLTSALGPSFNFELPIISSPMDTVTEVEMASGMSALGGFGIIHRYNSPNEQAELVDKFIHKAHPGSSVGFAVGVGDDMVERVRKCLHAGANIICVDVAHGHHTLVRHALKVLRNTFGGDVHIMAGNVATLEGFNDLSDWGADSIRVGIGGGSICSTRIQTGHGMPTLQSILECSKSDRDASLIADGGIKNSGDIVKCLAAGADFVMIGSLLAGTDAAPGEVIYNGGEKFKAYRGMASKEAQIDWRGHFSSIEGVSSMVPYSGELTSVVKDLEAGIRSGLSYSGASSIIDFQVKSKFIKQTSAGQFESSTHVGKK